MAANVMFHQLGRKRADRVFRERYSLDNMCEEEIRRRYRFSKESIKQIVDMIDPIIGPKTKRSQALSTEFQCFVRGRRIGDGTVNKESDGSEYQPSFNMSFGPMEITDIEDCPGMGSVLPEDNTEDDEEEEEETDFGGGSSVLQILNAVFLFAIVLLSPDH
uniref:Uncharacterized protein n=1 Tax=Magallana gigas TaxID=29159 RepID=A0A8W8P3J7_MAGGI